MKITKKLLENLNACSKGLEWWIDNVGEEFDSKNLPKIKGDYNEYISWLKDKIYNSTFDSEGNQLTYNDSEGTSWEKTKEKLVVYKDNKETCRIPLNID